MRHRCLFTFGACILFALGGCGDNPLATRHTPGEISYMMDSLAAPTKPAAPSKSFVMQEAVAARPVYTADQQSCNSRAQSRMSLYDKSNTSGDTQHQDAYLALYSACMQGRNWQVAGPARSPVNDAASLAAISPAAGGNAVPSAVTAGNATISASSVPGATVLVIGTKESPPPLSSLSPSAGGASAPNTTVVLVSPQNSPVQTAYAPPSAPAPALPTAIPVPAPAPTVSSAQPPATAAPATSPAQPPTSPGQPQQQSNSATTTPPSSFRPVTTETFATKQAELSATSYSKGKGSSANPSEKESQ